MLIECLRLSTFKTSQSLLPYALESLGIPVRDHQRTTSQGSGLMLARSQPQRAQVDISHEQEIKHCCWKPLGLYVIAA